MTTISADRPVYQQVADRLRRQINSGELPAGAQLPSENVLCSQHTVGLMTIRRALRQLAHEGLIQTQRGACARVRAQPARRTIRLGAGDVLIVRMPSYDEARDLGLPTGVPLLVLQHADGPAEILRGDQHQVRGTRQP